ncbi:MAG TPA: hypothetical protein VMT12_10325 [Syntrophales bacterium]|nr:hypothetical protein [Syntrophales bacterium]
MTPLTLKDILEGSEDKLGLEQITGKAGLMRGIDQIGIQRFDGKKNFWERLIPEVILIITPSCLHELATATSEMRDKIFQTVISNRVAGIAISKTVLPTYFILSFSEENNISLFTSAYDEFLLESRLLGLLREKINNVTSIHGALVNVFGIGVMITGDSSTGKTECARELVERGHAWIADDVIEIEKRENILYGRSHDLVKNLLHIKYRGIVDAKKFFVDSIVCDETVIDLLVELAAANYALGREGVYLEKESQDIMSIKLPCMQLPCFPYIKDIYRHVEHAVQRLLNERSVA